ncbi:M20/M25/M40 family metallo-hydrolase [Nocardioides panacihumi]|uniref:M20/M25/M40 family metallo-hydrolase n=1 Tax=Nocardioides panacihumi TaxID=400774 RepID=A0ABP5C694_9ACTN
MEGWTDALRAATERSFDAFVTELAALVSIDSGTDDRAGVARAAGRLVELLRARGMDVTRPPVASGVPPVVATMRGRGSKRLLLCGHLDTVFATGSAERRPFSVRDGIATGPGVCDDKGGLLAGVFAMEALLATGFDDFDTLTLLATTDEETGSNAARAVMAELAAVHDVGLCLEGARDDGSLVTGRAGVADVVVEVRGRAAHAGIEPERGLNAAVDTARLAVAIAALNGRWEDVKVNVGVLSSGERANVVPEHGRLVVDVRGTSADSFDAAITAIREVASDVPVGVQVTVRVENPAPPWRADRRAQAVADRAVLVAKSLGIDIQTADTGGSADANLLADLGLPVLDGLGPVGGGDHSADEWLDLVSAPDRLLLLAALIVDLCQGDPDQF